MSVQSAALEVRTEVVGWHWLLQDVKERMAAAGQLDKK